MHIMVYADSHEINTRLCEAPRCTPGERSTGGAAAPGVLAGAATAFTA
ncbi:MAG TPA: hypothetical protein PK969_05850 [Treponemataceae bacterium]|nr:hypothetical protein [Treponemataceae bacterium]